MKLTERQAVELSIELWEWLAETGKEKGDWNGWKEWRDDVKYECFLCEYVFHVCGKPCSVSCPYYAKYRLKCSYEASPYAQWESAGSEADKKKYARRFLNQLKEILEDMDEPVENETLIAESVEIDLETLDAATNQRGSLARWAIIEAVVDALDPEDRKKLEAYKNQ